MQLHRDTAWYFFNLLEIPLGAFVTCCPQPLLYDTVWIPVTFLANILITCFSEWLVGWYCKDGYCNGRNVAYKSIIRHQFCYCEERFGSKVQGHSFLTFSSNEFELPCWGEEGMVRPRVQFPFGACDFLYGQFFEKKKKRNSLVYEQVWWLHRSALQDWMSCVFYENETGGTQDVTWIKNSGTISWYLLTVTPKDKNLSYMWTTWLKHDLTFSIFN